MFNLLAISLVVTAQIYINYVKCHENKLSTYESYERQNCEISATTIALLVEDNPKSFKNALKLYKECNESSKDFWLITFNSSGVSTIWGKSQDSIQQFNDKLEALAAQGDVNPENFNQTLALFAILNTSYMLPENSSIIVFIDLSVALNSQLEKLTLNQILSKNISVYAVSNTESDNIKTLSYIVEFSGGRNLYFSNEPKFELYRYMPDETTSVILTRKKLSKTNKLSFPVDQDVTGLHIIIGPSKTTSGSLISPSGYKFAFAKNAKTNNIRYTRGSFFDNTDGFFEIHLNFSISDRKYVGIWHLNLENSEHFYNVSILAFTGISADAKILDSFKENVKYDNAKDVLKLGVTVNGKVSHITDISLLDINGILLSNTSFILDKNKLDYAAEDTDSFHGKKEEEVYVEVDRQTQSQPVYALLKGKDVKGNEFQRLSFIFDKFNNDLLPRQILTVEVGLGSELIASPLKKAEIYFEITNNADSQQDVTFFCSDQKIILQSLSTYKKKLDPHESTLVTLYLNTRLGTYQDEITFSAKTGSYVVQKKILVDVGSQIIDQNKPELSHRYTSDCTNVILFSCNKGSWSLEITARDLESGLLQLNTVPKGLYFPHGYTSGTKHSVVGHYSDSCCKPKLQISAVDRLNNVNTYEVNAYYATWSPGAIAALVLGILFFLILLVIIIYFAVKFYKKKKSYNLPTYRGGGI